MEEVSQTYFLFLLSLILFIYLFLHKLKPTNATNIKLPPGTTGFPLIGESLSFYLKIRKGFQYEFVKERMEKYSSKIFRTSLMGQPAAVLCGAEGNKFLFSNENKLVRLWWPSGMDKLFPKSDNRPASEHAYMLHKSVLPFFLKPDALRGYVGMMDEVMKQHLEAYWIRKDKVNVVEMAKKYTLALACNFFLGINDLDQIEWVVEGMDDIESAIIAVRINLPGTGWSRGVRLSEIMRSKIEEIVRQRKVDVSKQRSSSSNPAVMRDFISHMLLVEDENGQFLQEGDIASHLLGMIETAYTSLQTTITMLMKNLTDLPAVYESVLKEQAEIAESKKPGEGLRWEDTRKMKYSWNVACEVLRLYLPVIGVKEVITDFTYEGYTIPKGWKMHWIAQATHKNPKYFRDPEKFDPTRFDGDGPAPFSFIPFGGGSRMCPGNEYSRLAILTFVHYVVTEFRWEKIIPTEKLLQFPLPSPSQGLPIRLFPRKSGLNDHH